MRATWTDVIDGCAHIVCGRQVFRAAIPAMFSNNPQAGNCIVVDVYTQPGMPDSYEVMRIETPSWAAAPRRLARAMREKYGSCNPAFDE